jgi:Plavaka transposase
MSNKSAQCHVFANLFHACMGEVLDLITLHGETGLPMMSGDGVWQQCHPIFAVFIGDYPKQTLVTCTYNG